MKKLIIIFLFFIFGLFFFLPNLYSKEFNTNWTECYVDKYYKNTKFKGQPHGRADCFSENGDLYSGFFNRGVANGAISFRGPITKEHRFGKLKFIGNFKNNQPSDGSYYFDSGSEFDGNFKTTRKLHSFSGDFKNNKPWNGFVYWHDPFERKTVTEGKISSVNLGTISPKIDNIYYVNNDETSFGIALLLVLGILITILFFKFSKNKKILKKNKPTKITTKVYYQKNFSPFSFWHGQKGLALTFWGFFIGGNILLNGVTLIVADNQNLVIMNLMFFMLWNVLAVMGVFNAANIYKAEKMKLGQSYTGATAAKIAVVLLILSGIGNLIPR
jgi:hypothetical protein